uniref:Uncharacterized protein n=1 Tax=Rhizophora mucronata TaxID=61149 RepID=A0A2P2QLL3_RHIMU
MKWLVFPLFMYWVSGLNLGTKFCLLSTSTLLKSRAVKI